VSNLFQNLDFSGDPVYVSLVLDFALFKDFNGDSFVGDGVNPELNLTECAFAQSFLNSEMRDPFELSLRLFTSCIRFLGKYELLELIFLFLELCFLCFCVLVVVF